MSSCREDGRKFGKKKKYRSKDEGKFREESWRGYKLEKKKGEKVKEFRKIQYTREASVSPWAFSMLDTYSHPSSFIDGFSSVLHSFPFVLSFPRPFFFPRAYDKFPWTLVCHRRPRFFTSSLLVRETLSAKADRGDFVEKPFAIIFPSLQTFPSSPFFYRRIRIYRFQEILTF